MKPGLMALALWAHIASMAGLWHSIVPDPSQGQEPSSLHLPFTHGLQEGTFLSWHRPQLGKESLAWLGAWVGGQGGEHWPACNPREQTEGLGHCRQWVVTPGQMRGVWPWSQRQAGVAADACDKCTAMGVMWRAIPVCLQMGSLAQRDHSIGH